MRRASLADHSRAKEHPMYIGGGLVALVLIVLLLVYVF